jgi:hypothetical protein
MLWHAKPLAEGGDMKWLWFFGGFILSLAALVKAALGSESDPRWFIVGVPIVGPLCLLITLVVFMVERARRKARQRERITWHRGYAFEFLPILGSFCAGVTAFLLAMFAIGLLAVL